MALHARYRVDPAIDLVLAEVIPTVRQVPLNRILVFIAWLQFILMRVAVRAEGLFVANRAGLTLLLCEEPMPCRKIACMVQCCLSILVTVAAHGSDRHINGVLHGSAGCLGAGIETEEHHEQ